MPWFPPPDPAAVAQRRNLEAALDRTIPEWREIQNDPWWIGWLTTTHLYSDRARQFHLDDAVASGSVHRVAQFFKDFIAQRDATQPRPAPPPPQWGYRASPRDKPIYSRDDIINASRAYMKGAYKGREAEYEALQADIFAPAGKVESSAAFRWKRSPDLTVIANWSPAALQRRLRGRPGRPSAPAARGRRASALFTYPVRRRR